MGRSPVGPRRTGRLRTTGTHRYPVKLGSPVTGVADGAVGSGAASASGAVVVVVGADSSDQAVAGEGRVDFPVHLKRLTETIGRLKAGQ